MLLYRFDCSNKQLIMQPRGELDDKVLPQLRYCYKQHQAEVSSILFDCKAVNYFDSSLVPMLLEMHADAKNNRFNIIFSNMNDSILQEFRLLNLHKLFEPILDKTCMTVTWEMRAEKVGRENEKDPQ